MNRLCLISRGREIGADASIHCSWLSSEFMSIGNIDVRSVLLLACDVFWCKVTHLDLLKFLRTADGIFKKRKCRAV